MSQTIVMRDLLVAVVIVTSGLVNLNGYQSTPPASPRLTVSAKHHVEEELRTAGATAVLLDWTTGNALILAGKERTAAPGSLLKPLMLSYALQHGTVESTTVVYCRRTLHVAGQPLACTHPADRPQKNAEEALSASCNTWFASLARRMSSQDVHTVLARAGLRPTANLEDTDTRILTVLGLKHVQATPMQIAVAYRTLLLHTPHDNAVWNGLRGSVEYGMANNARLQGLEVLGKTGTATDPGEWWSHGWFAGGIPERFILVVYVPRGDGGTAATLAGKVMRQLMFGGKQ